MQEHELIRKIQSLKAIKPRPEWVSQLETQLFVSQIQDVGLRKSYIGQVWGWLPNVFAQHRLAFAAVGLFLIAGGLALASQSAAPGDPLYSVKKAVERVELAARGSFQDRQKAELQIVAKRLEELEKIAKENNAQKLAPAIKEYQAAASAAAKSLKNQPLKSVKAAKQVVQKTKELQAKEKAVEQILATELGSEELLNEAAEPYSKLADYHSLAEGLLKNLVGSALSEEQQKTLQAAQAAFEKGDYQEAFEKLLLITNINHE